jgi:serine/threonine protein kinase
LRDGCPNKFLPDGNVVVGGKTYKNPVVLDSGANGEAVRFTADDGTSIVLKMLKETGEELEDRLVYVRKEVDTHRYAMEGGGPGSEFLAPLLAPLRTPDGMVAVALQNCELGNVKSLVDGTGTLVKAVHNNLISGQAADLVRLQMASDLMKALEHLQHARHMMHLDIKPANIFLNAKGQLQVGDFGEGEMKMSDKLYRGTPIYQAPEMFADKIADMKSDTYSVGYMLYELFTGMMPFFDDTPRSGSAYDAREAWFAEHDGLAQGKYSTGNAALDALINGLTHSDLNQRLTFEEALQSPIFQPLTQNGGKEPQARSLLQMLGNLNQLEKQLANTPDDQALQNQAAWLKNQLMQSSAALGLGVGGTGNVG